MSTPSTLLRRAYRAAQALPVPVARTKLVENITAISHHYQQRKYAKQASHVIQQGMLDLS